MNLYVLYPTHLQEQKRPYRLDFVNFDFKFSYHTFIEADFTKI